MTLMNRCMVLAGQCETSIMREWGLGTIAYFLHSAAIPWQSCHTQAARTCLL